MYFTVDLIDVGITEVKMPSYDSLAACHFRFITNCITATMPLTGVAKSWASFYGGLMQLDQRQCLLSQFVFINKANSLSQYKAMNGWIMEMRR
jgi:hypothetical protein